jgi:hypothetical protein
MREVKYCSKKDFLDWYMGDGYREVVGEYIKKTLLENGEVYLTLDEILDHVIDVKLVPPSLFGVPFIDEEFFEFRLK